MSEEMLTVVGVVDQKAVLVPDKKTGVKAAKTVWTLRTDRGDMSCWDDAARWNPTGTWPVTVRGIVTNKPYNGKDQFTLKQVTLASATAAPAAPPVAPPPVVAPTAPTQLGAIKSAFDRMVDKDRIIARESILKSVAEMLDTLAKPLDEHGLSRGWRVEDVIDLCAALEAGYIYRTEKGE